MAGTADKIEFKKKFGDRVRQLREARNLTKTALADLIGIERQDIYKIEQGIRNATLETIATIAEALDVSPTYLFDFTEQLGELPKTGKIFRPEAKKTPIKKKQAKR